MRLLLLCPLPFLLWFPTQLSRKPRPSPQSPVRTRLRPMPVRRPILAATPPMGWNSWNFFAGKVTDKDIRGAADQIVATGMKDAGYIT